MNGVIDMKSIQISIPVNLDDETYEKFMQCGFQEYILDELSDYAYYSIGKRIDHRYMNTLVNQLIEDNEEDMMQAELTVAMLDEALKEVLPA